jgi:hypothetical protein
VLLRATGKNAVFAVTTTVAARTNDAMGYGE